ncbi:MAG: aspartate/tyrosine/aromatic aminotransferase [Proteobacteria bacterium]|nr:aspartate/tyrosine/aromatic aminotransferase [Pseudomonadota bacterium]MDA1331785.1 aspartate/tyrosine/aromatic aminotransferase [Pseudomonadota bacterium]
MTTSAFSGVELAPSDPILGLTELFKVDTNPNKVNLGVGVYYDDKGLVPLLECVKSAETRIVAKQAARPYLPIDGNANYGKLVQALLFGADSKALSANRIVTAQTLGGTGALKVGADFLKQAVGCSDVWISDPSWENHRGIFQNAGLKVNLYPYYDADTGGVAFDRMVEQLKKLPKQSVVLLHACCHNPTGVDLDTKQWKIIAELIVEQALIPFLDIAYQGFGASLEEDGFAVRLFTERCETLVISNSFSKSFSLYGERIGGLSIVSSSAEEAKRVQSQLKRLIRTNYSNPPIYSGAIVETVLADPDLRNQWDGELGGMRERIKRMRLELSENITKLCPDVDFSFIARQQGMFSYTGLSREQVVRLREECSIYAIESGRICVAALNSKNIGLVSEAIAKVIT